MKASTWQNGALTLHQHCQLSILLSEHEHYQSPGPYAGPTIQGRSLCSQGLARLAAASMQEHHVLAAIIDLRISGHNHSWRFDSLVWLLLCLWPAVTHELVLHSQGAGLRISAPVVAALDWKQIQKGYPAPPI